jgi:hypothetical protein
MNSLFKLASSAAHFATVPQGDDEDEEDDIDDEGDVEVAPPPKKVKKTKKTVKGSKKVEKSAKSSKSNGDSKNTIRLKDLAKQAKLTEAVCRKKLRDAEVPRGEGRWSWDLGSKALKQARKALGLSVA